MVNIHKIVSASAAVIGTAFVTATIIGRKKLPESRYESNPSEKNPLEGKRVVFVSNDDDELNADGVHGHLEAIGESSYEPGIYEKYIKRVVDILLSFGGMAILSPVLLGIAIAIKIDDPGPVLFTQKRIGKNKTYFKLHKFRSMKMSTPHDVPTHMLDNPEQYITSVGKFLRAHSLDELPQIWDIFIGNMSIIGPRPGLWNQDVLTSERDKYGANDIRPGLTGLAQINGRDELTLENKAILDGEYCKKIGPIMDAKVFLGSLGVFKGDDSVVEGGKRNQVNSTYANKCEDKKHKYSVLMSVYKNDNPKFLEIALRSVYDMQTVKPDEIVVVFDGPLTDELYAVLNNFKIGKEQVVKYYPQERNQGLGEALRIGTEFCTGDYILRMDSDDVSDVYRFEKQIAFAESHPEIDVIGSDIAEFNNSPDEENMRVRVCPTEHNDIVRMGKHRNPMNHVSTCIKKSALEKSGGYRSLLLLEDYYLWLHMIGTGCTLANIPESLVYVRIGNGFTSKRGDRERIEGWKELQNYMLQIGMINKREAITNMLYIYTFVNTPSWLKNGLYSKLLRK